MRALLKTILCISILASAVVDTRAQGRPRPDRAARSRRGAAAEKANEPVTSSLAERRGRYVALLQFREALRKYLATLDPAAAEHAATSKSLTDVEAKIAALEKSLLRTLASPTTEADEAAVSSATPDPDAERAAPERAMDGARRAPATMGGRMQEIASRDTPRGGGVRPRTAEGLAAATPQEDGDGQDPAEEVAPTPEPTPEPKPEPFTLWLNERIEEKTVALINQGSNANQTESPAASESSTSLVDQSSASDLVGVALNLAGLSGGTDDKKDANTATVTVSAYSLYSAFKGADPLDPAFYNRNKNWRKLSLTLGFDNEKKEGDEGATDRVTLAGFKWLIINGRDASNNQNSDERGIIINALSEAAGSFGRLDEEIKGFLFRSDSVRGTLLRNAFRDFLDEESAKLNSLVQQEQQKIRELERSQPSLTDAEQAEVARLKEAIRLGQNLTAVEQRRLRKLQPLDRRKAELSIIQNRLKQLVDLKTKDFNTLLKAENSAKWSQAEINFARVGFRRILLQSGDSFQKVLDALTPEEREMLDKYIDSRIDPFVKLKGRTRAALEEIRSRPQFSFAALAKRRQEGADEYTSDIIYERGLGTRTFATLNMGFKYKDSKLVGGDSRGGRAAGQLQFQITPEESLVSKSPLYLYLSGDAEWLSGVKPKYKAQAKVKIPVTDGIEIPGSLTFANRTDLIDETDVRGQFGFTFDTAKLLRAFKFKLPTFGSRALAFAPLLIPEAKP